MINHKIKVYPSKINLPKKKQLAWKIAEIASDNAKLNNLSIEMAINRIIDNASVAIASLNRAPVVSARAMAKKHFRKKGYARECCWNQHCTCWQSCELRFARVTDSARNGQHAR